MKERADGARSSFQTVMILVAIPLVGMAVFFLWQWLNDGITPKETVQEVRGAKSAIVSKKVEESTNADALPRVTPKRARRSTADRRLPTADSPGDIVLIIDDLGFEGQPLERVMALDPNINLAILPNGTRAEEFAKRLHARGFEVLCHLPMQPRGRETPGRNAILASMSDDEIASTTRRNIEAVPHARGVNNHMGSLATADRRIMTSVLGALPDGMYFIDSRTGGSSVAATVAREMNVRTASRHVFLDDVATESAVRRQLAELAAAASKRGVAIGIGHPYPVTLRVLADELPALKARGFRLVRASSVVN
ncbi:MAG: divergent polysaccharide deacetylase family protein [Acidobacteriota bacterium]|nr:divergent polysaccharide deacetylase family protein [Acidobacteriota bacterium]